MSFLSWLFTGSDMDDLSRLKAMEAYSRGQLKWVKEMKKRYPTFPFRPAEFIEELWKLKGENE